MAIFGRKSVAGVEMDSFEIRVVEISGSPASPVLTSSGRIALPEGAVKDGKIGKPDVVANALSRLWSENGIRTRNVLLGISNQDILLRFAYFPKVTPDKMDNLVRYQAQDFLPITVSEVELDYMVLGEIAGERGPMLHVLLVAARKAMLLDYVTVFKAANLNILDIDSNNLAMMRLLPPVDRIRTNAVLCLTKEQAGILILRNGIPGLARIAMTNALTPALKTLEIEETYHQTAVENEEENDSAVGDALIAEIRSSIAYFQNQNQDQIIEKIFLCGSVGGTRGVAQELQEKLGVLTKVLEPSISLRKGGTGKSAGGSGAADYALCISLALRGLEGGIR